MATKKKETKSMEAKKNYIIAGALLLAFMMGRWSTNQSPASAEAEAQKARSGKVKQSDVTIQQPDVTVQKSDVTVQQLQEVLNKNKQMTSLRREEALRNYINKQVQWKGTLKSAYSSEGELWGVISHRIKPSRLLGQRQVQVIVNFADSQKETLLNAQKGSLVTYQGVLSKYTGSAKRPWLLTDGQILSVEIIKPKVTAKSRLQ